MYQAPKGKQMLVDLRNKEKNGLYFTAVYLFILGIWFLLFFLFVLEEIKSHFPFLNICVELFFYATIDVETIEFNKLDQNGSKIFFHSALRWKDPLYYTGIQTH